MAALSPGVRVREAASGNVAISGASTSIAAFIGMSTRGPVDEPVLVTDLRSFEQRYGTDTRLGELPGQVRQFFANGGSSAYVLRVARDDPAHPLAAATVDIDDETGVARLRLEARSPGEAENVLRVVVDYGGNDPDRTFDLTLYREVRAAGGRLERHSQEIHAGLSMDPDHAAYVVTRLDRSSLVTAEVLNAPAPAAGISASGRGFVDPAAADAALGAAAGAGGGSLSISVAGEDPVPVPVAAGATVADLAATVTGLLAGRVAVSFSGGRIVFASTGTEDVRITPGGADDVTAELELGLPAGIEIGAWAASRPNPNGLVYPAYDPGTGYHPMAALTALSGTRPLQLAVVGPQARYRVDPFTPGYGGGGSRMDVIEDGDERSMLTVRQQLQRVANDFGGTTEWSGAVQGNRLVLRPADGEALDGHGHRLVRPDVAGDQPLSTSDVAAYRFDDTPASLTSTAHSATAGGDGAPPDHATYQAALGVLERVPAVNLVTLPRSTDGDEGRQSAWGLASAMCQRKRALLLVDPPSTWRSQADAVAGIARLRAGAVKDHCAVYWPRVEAADGTVLDPSGTMAGIMAQTDAARGVWFPPAGDAAAMTNVRGVAVGLTDVENGFVNEQAVNAVRVFPQGVLAWGARTMDGFDNSGNTDNRYVNVRRLGLFLASSLEAGLRFAVFKPNDDELWAQIRNTVRSFMRQQWRRGAFRGLSEDQAFYVRCDATTTTQLDIDLGYVNVEVGFAPVKPAEFVEVVLRQMAGQAQG